MTIETFPFDAADYLKTPEMQAEFLSLAIAEGDPAEINRAIGTVARARGMTAVAKAASLGRESLYKSLSEDGNPAFATIIKVLAALDMELTVRPATPPA